MKRRFASAFVTAVGIAVVAPMLLAASKTVDGVTVTTPDFPLTTPGVGTPLLSCEPWNSAANRITVSGVPEGATVTVNFGWFDPYGQSQVEIQQTLEYPNVTGGSVEVPVGYPSDTATWPYVNAETLEKAIGVVAFVTVNGGGKNIKITTDKWWVRCLPPPPPPPDKGEAGGCTPGYWKQKHHFDSWQGFVPTDNFETVFGVDASFNPTSLLDALTLGGGGEKALARHAVAALLNASHSEFTYAYTAADIISGVQAAYASKNFEPFKDLLDRANNTGCPLN